VNNELYQSQEPADVVAMTCLILGGGEQKKVPVVLFLYVSKIEDTFPERRVVLSDVRNDNFF
jgi:hypothetical protein